MSAKKKKKFIPNHEEEIEVIMRKKMTVQKYHELKANPKTKGWSVQGYQKNFFTPPLAEEI